VDDHDGPRLREKISGLTQLALDVRGGRGFEEFAISSAEIKNDAASTVNASCRPNTSAIRPPSPAPTISIEPHTIPITACAAARSSMGTPIPRSRMSALANDHRERR